jgi:hypothetical protein
MSTPSFYDSYLSSLLNGVGVQTIASALENLLEQKINISQGTRSRASDSHNHLRDFLRSEASRDATFPRVLSGADADFLGGSFGRHTKIWPLDDIDIYFPLDGANLFYLKDAVRLPYVVQSAGPRLGNPLLLPRWAAGLYVSSMQLIQEFARILKRHNPRTEVRAGGQSISMQMTHGETQDSRGLGYDIVPCFLLKPDHTNEFEFYLMPDGHGGWIRTNPKLDADVAEILQAFNGKFYRSVIKLIKYWNKTRLDGAFSSYYVELALSRAFFTRKQNNQPIGSLSEGLAAGFEILENAYKAGDQTPWISDAPLVQKPNLSAEQSLALSLAQIGASLAWLLEKRGNESDAVRQWSEVFRAPL